MDSKNNWPVINATLKIMRIRIETQENRHL